MADQQQQQTIQHLVHLLNGLTQPDTQVIRTSEAALKPFLKQPATMEHLWLILKETSVALNVRQIAGVVLRKKLPSHLPTLNVQQWQQMVLQQLAMEQVRFLRQSLIGIVGILFDQETVSPILLEFLKASSSNDAELCFLVLSELTDVLGRYWKPQVHDLKQLYEFGITQAQNAAAQGAALQALGQLMSYWCDEPTELSVLLVLLPTMLQVASQQNDDDVLTNVLDVLYDLAYSSAECVLQHVELCLQFCITILQHPSLELRVRDAAALVLSTFAEAKPKTVGRQQQLLNSILDVLLHLIQCSETSAAGALFDSNPSWRADLNLDDEVEDGPTETGMAQGTLDMLACEIPTKFFWNNCLTKCTERLQSPDPNVRKSGLAGLGVIAEGCAEPMSSILDQILPALLQLAQDPSHQVRESACFCLGQISEHCQPDILAFADQILPVIFLLLDDGSVEVQATSCYVLEMFCERLDPAAVRPFLDNLVRKLVALLETKYRSVQEMAVAALAATAVAAEAEFTPYLQVVAHILSIKFLNLEEEKDFTLRGRALECMGHMAIAVGQESFRPYFADTMKCALFGLNHTQQHQTESTDLQEFAFAVFANLSKVMKEEFAPALNELVPVLVATIAQEEGHFEKADNDQAFGFDSDEEENDNLVLHVRTALLDVKKGAITALGEMAAHTGTSFCPHIEASMHVFQKAASNWHPLVKAEVAEALPSLIAPSVAAYHNGHIEWTKGQHNSVSQHTSTIMHAVITEELGLLKDDEKTVVAKACMGLQNIFDLCGPAALSPVVNEVLQATHQLLMKAAPCQSTEGLFGEMPDDDDDHDVVMQAACDLVGSFGRVMGKSFAQYLPQFLPVIVDFGKSSRPPSDRSMAVGCLSELAEELEDGTAEHWKSTFLPSVLAGLTDPDYNVKRNAAFCAGLCCQNLKDVAVPDYPALLQVIGPIFAIENTNDSAAACIDNAAAALARMIQASPGSIPLNEVLPVWLKALPLKSDLTEYETIVNCLVGLIQMKHISANSPDVQRIAAEICAANSTVEAPLQEKLRSVLQ